jgi:hypothetical protein
MECDSPAVAFAVGAMDWIEAIGWRRNPRETQETAGAGLPHSTINPRPRLKILAWGTRLLTNGLWLMAYGFLAAE